MGNKQLDAVNEYAHWVENDIEHKAAWMPISSGNVPKRIIIADDTLTADSAFRLITQGAHLLWRGDFQNGKQLLQALQRRINKKNERKPNRKRQTTDKEATTKEVTTTVGSVAFNRYRLEQSQRAELLNRLLLQLDENYSINLRRAPDVQMACNTALGPLAQPALISFKALLGLVGAYEWRKKGVRIKSLPQPVHVHYGVFSPNRGEYIELLTQASLPATDLAFDIGTGSGVLAAVLANRGVKRIIATDISPLALACATENINNMGWNDTIHLQVRDLFPEGKSGLIVCNPPWLPARPTTLLEHAIYDPDSQMLLGFLNGLHRHLRPGGQAWLIMSDLAEHLGLRSPSFLPDAIQAAGLRVLGKLDTKPSHGKAMDASDPLHYARSAEVTSLWQLGLANDAAIDTP